MQFDILLLQLSALRVYTENIESTCMWQRKTWLITPNRLSMKSGYFKDLTFKTLFWLPA